MKYIFVFTLVFLAIVALTGRKETTRQYFALSALSIIAVLSGFGSYYTSSFRGYKVEPFQVVALQVCFIIVGVYALRIGIRKKK